MSGTQEKAGTDLIKGLKKHVRGVAASGVLLAGGLGLAWKEFSSAPAVQKITQLVSSTVTQTITVTSTSSTTAGDKQVLDYMANQFLQNSQPTSGLIDNALGGMQVLVQNLQQANVVVGRVVQYALDRAKPQSEAPDSAAYATLRDYVAYLHQSLGNATYSTSTTVTQVAGPQTPQLVTVYNIPEIALIVGGSIIAIVGAIGLYKKLKAVKRDGGRTFKSHI